MNLDELPRELRVIYENALLTAEDTENESIKLALHGLRHALEEDFARLRSARETSISSQAATKEMRI